jgi:hypothetical protein
MLVRYRPVYAIPVVGEFYFWDLMSMPYRIMREPPKHADGMLFRRCGGERLKIAVGKAAPESNDPFPGAAFRTQNTESIQKLILVDTRHEFDVVRGALPLGRIG